MIKVVYLGERVELIGNISQVFRDKKGTEYRFTGVKNIFFGECYEVSEEGVIKTRPSVVQGGPEVTEKERLRYESNKEIVKYQRLLRRKQMKLKKPHQDIVRAVQLLKPFYMSLGHSDQHRFMQYVSNQLSKPVKLKR